MKKQSFVLGIVVILSGTFSIISCKKDNSASVTPPASASSTSASSNTTAQQVFSASYAPPVVRSGTSFQPVSDVNGALQNLNWQTMLQNVDSNHHTSLLVNLPSLYNSTNTRVFAIGQNRAIAYVANADNNLFSNYWYNYPDKSTWNILAIAIVDGQYYYGIKPITIDNSTNNVVTFDSRLSAISKYDLIEKINAF